ncbi:MAG TPA: hypothetical protein VIF09_26275 [Polyangiaceae bacterium]|jgi:hypothetical protein
MTNFSRTRAWIALCACIVWAFAVASACGSKGSGGAFEAPGVDASLDGAGDATSGGHDSGPAGDTGNGDAPTFGNPDAGATTLSITPGSPAAAVTITNGTLATSPVPLQAMATNGNGSIPVAATWSFDRGELGAIDASGTFTANGNLGGVGTVTAIWNGLTATAKLTVTLTVLQNGGPTTADGGVAEAGAGGIGGVGGSGPGGPVSAGTQTILGGTPTAPDGGAELGWLYPYDQTVWPRGILAPLLQWATTHTLSAVYIHVTEANYEFKGFYSGTALVNQPIDATAWRQATYGNSGDKLHVSVVVTDGTTAWGPISEDWIIAPGVLQGTVYYGSYNSTLAGASNGAVLAIRPGATAPNIAIPGTATTCNVCHEVSSDGSTLYMENNTAANGYGNGTSYDLTKDGGVITAYPGPGSSAAYEKFAWSAVYPDGTFALANGGGNTETREGYAGPSQLFKRSDGTAIPTSGFTTAVTNAATPTFSTDGKEVAFNYWTGTATNGVSPGSGHNLAVMDFDCGQAEGGTGCSGSPPYTFSNLRQIYSDSGRFPGWPAFLPDTSGLVFHNTLVPGSCGACDLTTWNGAEAEIWWSNMTPSSGGTAQPVRLDALNGVVNGGSYLPANANHTNDSVLNYEPTVNPIASGGYFWVVFTSRRMYGNVAAGNPYDGGNGTYPIPKKLWVAALDIHGTAGKDISHPAFYLPGQELNAGNLRGFWVVNPCQVDGTSCLTGDECCNGFCRQGEAGGLVCTTQPPGCSNEYEKCATAADCCGVAQGFQCINGHCASPGSQ